MIAVPAAFVAMLLLGSALASASATALAGTAGLKHERSIYADERGGRLDAPEGVACAEGGKLVVADTGGGRLLVYAWRDGQLRGGEEIKLPQLPYPTRVQMDGSGNLLALDGRLRRIARLDAGGRFAGYLDLRPRPPAEVVPIAFKVSARGDVYVLDAAGRRVLVASAAGRIMREVPLPRGGSFTDVAVGAGGKVYAIDAASATLWVAGGAGGAFRPAAPSFRDRMRFPADLAIDPGGRVFVVDRNGDAIAVLGADGSFEGSGLASGRGDGLLYYPAQICVTGSDVFVADRNNNRVQVFAILR
ncbi:MAG TPA: NHL repeat-containing protein [Anaeromyxobacter sp.]